MNETFNNYVIFETDGEYEVCDFYGTKICSEREYIDANKDATLLQFGYDEGFNTAKSVYDLTGED